MSSETLSDLIIKVRRRAGLEASANIISSDQSKQDDEVKDAINSAWSTLRSKLIETNEDMFLTQSNVTVSSPATSLTLPSDFYKFKALDKVFGNVHIEVSEFNRSERNDRQVALGYNIVTGSYPVPRYRLLVSSLDLQPPELAPGSYILEYVADVSYLSSDGDTIILPSNWIDFVTEYAAIILLSSMALPCDDLKENLARLEASITKAAMRRGQPRKMAQLRNRRRSWP